MICIYCLTTFVRGGHPPEYGSMFCSPECAAKDAAELEDERRKRKADLALVNGVAAYLNAGKQPVRAVTSPQPRPAKMNIYRATFSEGPNELTSDGVLVSPEVTLTLRKDPK